MNINNMINKQTLDCNRCEKHFMFQGIRWCEYRLKAFWRNKNREMLSSWKQNGSSYTKSKFTIMTCINGENTV